MIDFILTYVVCTVVIGILLLGMYLQKEHRDKSEHWFIALLYAVLGFLIFSLAAELPEGNSGLSWVTYTFNLCSFFWVDAVEIAFCMYLYSLLELANRNEKALKFAIAASVLRSVLTTLIFVSGNLFTVYEGHYKEENMIMVPYLFSGIIVLILISVLIKNRKVFSRRQITVMLLYLILPIFPIVLETYTKLFSLTGISLTMSVLLIYVFIQATAIERGKMREAVLEEISSTDLLTNLNNRRAFYNQILRIGADMNVGVVFCDLNGLKRTNDNFGHSAGDELLKKFAEIVSGFFGADKVFRISGDEFIVLVPNISMRDFLQKAEDFKKLVDSNQNIAAVGYSYGPGNSIERLSSEAEDMMYEDKRLNKPNYNEFR